MIIQNKYGIIIDQTYHIINNTIQEYWGTNTKEEMKFQKLPFPIDASYDTDIFMDTPLIGEDFKRFEQTHGGQKPLSRRSRSYYSSNMELHSISYHVIEWVHEFPHRTSITCL